MLCSRLLVSEFFVRAATILGGIIVCALFIGAPIYFGAKAQKQFKTECVQVGGIVAIDSEDGDLECYRDGREIAEFGDNSPTTPKR